MVRICHRCAHWLAMTCKNLQGVSVCKDATASPLSLRGAKRRGNPFSLRQYKTKRNTFGEYVRRYEFAQGSANLPGFPAGKRIATPRRPKVRHAQLRPKARAGQRSLGAPLPTKGAPLRGPMHRFAMTCRRRWRVSGCKDVCAMTCRNMRRECDCKGVSSSTPAVPGNYADT